MSDGPVHAAYVFVGGGTGAVMRWAVGLWVPAPWGTMAVNVLGSFGLALLLHPGLGVSPTWRLALGTGMMGGFTTYSTFNHDVISAMSEGRYGHAALVAGGSLVACVLGGLLGWWVAGLLRA